MADLTQRIKHVFMNHADKEKAAMAKAHQAVVADVGTFLDKVADKLREELPNYKARIEKRDDPAGLSLATLQWGLNIDAREITAEDRAQLKDKFDTIRDIAKENNVRLTLRGLPGEAEPLLGYMDPNEPQNPLQVSVETSQPFNRNTQINYNVKHGMG